MFSNDSTPERASVEVEKGQIIEKALALELNEGAGEFLGQPVLSETVMMITVGVLAIIGFIAGVFPARKAASVEPVESLRYE